MRPHAYGLWKHDMSSGWHWLDVFEDLADALFAAYPYTPVILAMDDGPPRRVASASHEIVEMEPVNGYWDPRHYQPSGFGLVRPLVPLDS